MAAKPYHTTQNANSMLRKEVITEDNPNENCVGEEGRKKYHCSNKGDEEDWWR
jgi:hypothetical protein